MAKIILTIEDSPGDKVKVTCDPTFETMMLIAKHGKLESSHGYAFAAINAIRKESKSKEPSLIKIPRIHLN